MTRQEARQRERQAWEDDHATHEGWCDGCGNADRLDDDNRCWECQDTEDEDILERLDSWDACWRPIL